MSILTHKGTWVGGEATQCATEATRLWLHTDEDVGGGTSGGPVVNENGELLGVVSFFGGTDGVHRSGAIARPHLTLPQWALRKLLAA